MSKRRKAPPQKRGWSPLQPAHPLPLTPERAAAIRAEAEALGADPDKVLAGIEDDTREMWMNDRYTVTVWRGNDGNVGCISVRRNDRRPDMAWRDLQRIKSQLAGDEAEAVELYPAESRLMDTANQRWLWCMTAGQRVPVGFENERQVTGPERAAAFGGRQAPLDA